MNPVIDPNFQVSLVEVDANNVTILEEYLAFDIDLRRSHMYAEGSLVHGAMEQIKRCDIHPEGWFSSAGGPNPDAPSTWTCTNMTIDRVGEMPQNCQYSTFWGFPDDMKYAGPAVLNGIPCDQWTYFSQGDEYTLYATMLDEVTGESIPVANGKIWSATNASLWMLYYRDFIAGPPPDTAFTPVEGCSCPDSTPP